MANTDSSVTRRVVSRRKPLPGTLQKYRKVAAVRVKNPGISLAAAVEEAGLPDKSLAKNLYGNVAYKEVEDCLRAKKEAALDKFGVNFEMIAEQTARLITAKKEVPVVLHTYGVNHAIGKSYIEGEEIKMVEVDDLSANVNALKLAADMRGMTSASQKFIQNNITTNNTVNIGDSALVISKLSSAAKAQYMDDYRKANRMNEPIPNPRDYLEGEFNVV